MSTPDEKAAAFDPGVPPPPPVKTLGDLTEKHIGLTIDTLGVQGELIDYGHVADGTTTVTLQEDDRTFPTLIHQPWGTSCEIVNGDLVQLTDVVSMGDFYRLARELDQVSKEIRNSKDAISALTARKEKLSEKLLGTFAQVGQETLAFDNRRAYVHHEVIPEFEEKEDGSRYTYRDLVPVLRALGREEQVTEATVGYRTLQGILREIKEGAVPMPPELAKMVKIGEKVEVRTGVGRKSKR